MKINKKNKIFIFFKQMAHVNRTRTTTQRRSLNRFRRIYVTA